MKARSVGLPKERFVAMSIIETRFIDKRIDYSGRELRSHFVREVSGIKVDGVVAFIGACNVSGDSLVDLEDSEAGDFIESAEMLSFIGEHFGVPIVEANLRLRLFASIVKDVLEELTDHLNISREGDDLFVDDAKLTVAISTVSPVSSLFHFGINIDPSGAPVRAAGLGELGIDPRQAAELVLGRYSDECKSIELAVRKVRGTL